MYRKYENLFAIITPMMVALTYFVIFFVFLKSYSSTVPSAVKQKLVIDHDGGSDDAMAIFMALLNEKHFNGPEVVALTTTHGNVDEAQVFNNSQRILSTAERRDIPIYRGSSHALIKNIESDYFFGYDGLGDNNTDQYAPIAAQEQHAAIGLIDLSKKYSGDLVIVALGALTNIALAIRIDPDFMSRLSQLYVAAGHIYSEDYKKPEFNAHMDVESYHIVVESGSPDKLTIIPFSQILIHQKISKEWRLNVLGAIDTKLMQVQNQYERKSIPLIRYWCLLDPAAMAIVLNETSIVQESRYSKNGIHLCGDQRGININNMTSKDEANAHIIYEVRKEPFKQMLYDLFSADLNTVE